MLLAERIAAKTVRMPNGCLEWHGLVNRQGYGRMYSKGSMKLIHRLAWELANGPIPDGMCVLHHCDNPPCHDAEKCLFLGTVAENIADKIAKGRDYNQQKTHCPQGHPYSGDNLYVQKKSGGRKCRICSKAALVRFYERQSLGRVAVSPYSVCR